MARLVLALMFTLLGAGCGGGYGDVDGQAKFASQLKAAAGAEIQAPTVVTPEMMLDWAEYSFPDLFGNSVAVRLPAIAYQGVTYNARLYQGEWGERYLGITPDGRIFGLGDFTGGALRQFDDIGAWTGQVLASLCNGPAGPANCFNASPVAQAGDTQNVTVGALVTLNGAASTDANNDLLTFAWTLVSKPAGSQAALVNRTTGAPSFKPDMAGSYLVALVVNDGRLSSPATTVAVVASTRIPDSGVTRSQCYAAGSNLLIDCGSTAALALSDKQDGMVGLDASNPESSDGKLGFSYTKLDGSGNTLAPSATAWACLRDNITGLAWEVKTDDMGLRDKDNKYTNYDDNRGGDASAFATAVNATKLCGYADWRVPSLLELQGIADYSKDDRLPPYQPAIDGEWFINTVAANYWSSTGFVGDSSDAWNVDFRCGTVGHCSRGTLYAVRLVRGSPPQTDARYSYSDDGSEVIDSRTGLIWRRCSEGMAWNGSSCTGVAATYSHEGALAHAKTQIGWRLPNVKELESIVDMARMNPAIDTAAFPNTVSSYYWSGTPFVGDSSYAWVVVFDYGQAYGGDRTGLINIGGTAYHAVAVRLVRDGGS